MALCGDHLIAFPDFQMVFTKAWAPKHCLKSVSDSHRKISKTSTLTINQKATSPPFDTQLNKHPQFIQRIGLIKWNGRIHSTQCIELNEHRHERKWKWLNAIRVWAWTVMEKLMSTAEKYLENRRLNRVSRSLSFSCTHAQVHVHTFNVPASRVYLVDSLVKENWD